MNKDDKMTILGVTGFTGAWLAKSLTDAGYTTITGTYRDVQKLIQMGSAAAIYMKIADTSVITITADTWPDLDHMDAV